MKKEYTPFGKFFSELRKQRKETLEDAAEKLGVSISYISAVEHGDRVVPDIWENMISESYCLNADEKKNLHDSIVKTIETLTITVDEMRSVLMEIATITCVTEEEREKAYIEIDKRIVKMIENRK